jgi:hypothetical protein
MAQLVHPETLSQGDELTLNQVFDPESAPEAPRIEIDASLPPDPHISDLKLLKELQKRELNAIKLVEEQSQRPHLSPVNLSSQIFDSQDGTDKDHVYLEALDILSELILQHPNYASAYNNRAQLRRWRFGDNLIISGATDQIIQSALEATVCDLREAITLSSPDGADSKVSPPQAKLLMQAWTQLGAVFWNLGKTWKSNQHIGLGSSDEQGQSDKNNWVNWDGTRLEEEGSRCFFMAGLYGSDFGRNLAVKMNPYARLCGSIVKEALKREGSL